MMLEAKNPSLFVRIFVWSLLLELFLFFNIPVMGQSPSVSRFLQVVVLAGLVVKFFSHANAGDGKLIDITHPNYRCYSLYFGLAVLAGIISLLSSADSAYLFDASERGGLSRTKISPLANSALEYVIALYYFAYFAVLPRYLLRTVESVDYFFSRFRLSFVVCLVLGFIDLGASLLGHPLLPIDLSGRASPGARFHGLTGEPREAFVYLFFGVAVLYLEAHYKGRRFEKAWLIPVILAAIATQSASGMIGILIFLGMYSIYSLSRFSGSQLLKLAGLTVLIVGFLYVAVGASERTKLYLDGMSGLWYVLESGFQVPYPISTQVLNIYPIYDLTVKVRDLDILPVLIGSGLGSASIVNNRYLSSSYFMVSSPHSQIVRVIYEAGLVGTLLFVFSFVSPVKHLTRNLSSKKRKDFLLVTLLTVGCFFGHRTAACFIYLGAFLAVFRVMGEKEPAPAGGA